MGRQLIDLASAQFKIGTIRHVGSEGAVAFCGVVNLKSRFGGYTGFRPFVLLVDDLTIYDGRAGAGAAFAQLQQLMCDQ